MADDPSVKGIWVVPTYANPSGAVYTEAVTRALVAMPAAAPDFRIFWDNAYAVHHLTDDEQPALDVLGMAAEAGNPDRVFVFASTSKITFAGAGVSFFASSPANVDWYLKNLGKRTIGPDKVNHLRHARFLGGADGVRALMRRHRAMIGPKFDQVATILTERLGAYERGQLDPPAGRLLHQPRRARRHREPGRALAKDAGIAMTGAGPRSRTGATPGTGTSASPPPSRPPTTSRPPSTVWPPACCSPPPSSSRAAGLSRPVSEPHRAVRLAREGSLHSMTWCRTPELPCARRAARQRQSRRWDEGQ